MHHLAKIRHVVLDLDGTIYLGGTLFEASVPFLTSLAKLGIGATFVTNNCSRSRAQYVVHLQELGIEATPEAIFTSAHATVHYLETYLPGITRLFVLGTDGLAEDLRLAGFEPVDERPDAVVVGFDPTLQYDRLARTAYWIDQQLPYIATNPDRVCPTDQPIVLPDCGAICALLESAVGRSPDAVVGKPNPAMLEGVMQQNQVTPEQTAMIGDRLYTDVRMARDAGALAVLTLTGETKQEQLKTAAAHERPDIVIENLGELAELLRKAQRSNNDAARIP